MPANRLALFDFDGTITSRDTLFEFIRFTHGDIAFFLRFTLLMPVLVLMKLGLITNQRAKEIVLAHFFGGQPQDLFNQKCFEFTKTVGVMIRPGAMKSIRELKEQKARIIVVSASPENWVKPWCDSMGIECIATKLETSGQLITGRISGLNCHGEEKVRRIREVLTLADYNEILAFGDTPSDRPMMSVATESFYKPFR